MFKLRENAELKSTPQGIRPGSYLAEIIAVCDSENYAPGDAFIVSYKLYDFNSQHVGEFQETFLNNIRNPRTKDLANLMRQLGADEVEELIGQTILVSIKYRVTDRGYRLSSIESREPIPTSPTPPGTASEENL